MITITEIDKERIRNGERAYVVVSAEYFREGDYTHWQDNSDETKDMSYDEFEDWLVQDMKKYDSIVVFSDGCIYCIRGGISHDIEYTDFDDVETFIELAEKYGEQAIEYN